MNAGHVAASAIQAAPDLHTKDTKTSQNSRAVRAKIKKVMKATNHVLHAHDARLLDHDVSLPVLLPSFPLPHYKLPAENSHPELATDGATQVLRKSTNPRPT